MTTQLENHESEILEFLTATLKHSNPKDIDRFHWTATKALNEINRERLHDDYDIHDYLKQQSIYQEATNNYIARLTNWKEVN